MRTKPPLIVLVVLALMLVATACGSDTDTDLADPTPDADTDAAPDTDDDTETEGADEETAEVVRVGITQFATIPPLDGLREAFIARMDQEYGEDGWEYEYLPAEGNVGNTSSIAQQLAGGDFDIYLAIATPSGQALAQVVTDRPIVLGAVAEPVAAGIREDNEGDDGNVTGVSSLGPIADQMQLIVDSVPDLETMGFIYNDAEQNAILQTDIAEEELLAIGEFGTARQTAATSGEVGPAAQQLASETEAIWFPASSTALEGLPALYQLSQETGVPIFCADTTAVDMNEDGSTPRGCLGTVGFSFPGSGTTAAELAIRILNGEDPGSIPTVFPEAEEMALNLCAAEAIGFTLPQEVIDRADTVHEC